MHHKILILGACGQIGTELTIALREQHGVDNVVASDIRATDDAVMNAGPFEILDATDLHALEDVIMHYEIETVYLMAAMLSGTAEKFPMKAWSLNMDTLFHVLNLAKDKKYQKYSGPLVLLSLGQIQPKKTPHSSVLWHPVAYME